MSKSLIFVEIWQNFDKKVQFSPKYGNIMLKKVQFSSKDGKIMAKKSNFHQKGQNYGKKVQFS